MYDVHTQLPALGLITQKRNRPKGVKGDEPKTEQRVRELPLEGDRVREDRESRKGGGTKKMECVGE